MRTLVCALVFVSLAVSGAVAQETGEERRPGEVKRAGATRGDRSATAIESGLTGCWESGEPPRWLVWLVQRGNRVWGFYVTHRPNRQGHLQGTLQGKRLDYNWWENQENGSGYFELSDDGLTMNGKWHYDFARRWGGNWGLKRTVGVPEARQEFAAVERAVDDARARAGELAQAFQVYAFQADPRTRTHDAGACCATHAERLREAIPAITGALAAYVRTGDHVDPYAQKIAARMPDRLGQLQLALDAHARAPYVPAANRAMERVKLAVSQLDNCFVWLEASLAIEVACRRLRLHLAAPEEAQDREEFQSALADVKQTAATLQGHYRAMEEPVGLGLAGQMMQIATDLDEVVVAGLETGGELRAAALERVRAGYAALLEKKAEIDACCGAMP